MNNFCADVEITCPACLVSWRGARRVAFLRKHVCLKTPQPSLTALITALEVSVDERGCFIPTVGVSPYGGKPGHRYWRLTTSLSRVLGCKYAHRAVLKFTLGRNIELDAAHECGDNYYANNLCVNPAHIVERSRSENMRFVDPIVKIRAAKIAAQSEGAITTRFKPGQILTEARKIAISAGGRRAWENRNRVQKQIKCPHCDRKGGHAMYRWHFDNCKQRPS